MAVTLRHAWLPAIWPLLAMQGSLLSGNSLGVWQAEKAALHAKVAGCRRLLDHLLVPHLVPLCGILPKEFASRQQEAI